MSRLRGLPRRKHGKNAAGAIDQLDIGDKVAKFIDVLSIEKPVALDNHQHVIFVRWKAPRQVLKLMELGCIGAKQGTERIVDLELCDPEGGKDAKRCHDHRGQKWRSKRNKPDALEAQHEAIAARDFWRDASSGGLLVSIVGDHGQSTCLRSFGVAASPNPQPEEASKRQFNLGAANLIIDFACRWFAITCQIQKLHEIRKVVVL